MRWSFACQKNEPLPLLDMGAGLPIRKFNFSFQKFGYSLKYIKMPVRTCMTMPTMNLHKDLFFCRPLNKLCHRLQALSVYMLQKGHVLKAAGSSTLGLPIKILWPNHWIYKCSCIIDIISIECAIFIVQFNRVVYSKWFHFVTTDFHKIITLPEMKRFLSCDFCLLNGIDFLDLEQQGSFTFKSGMKLNISSLWKLYVNFSVLLGIIFHKFIILKGRKGIFGAAHSKENPMKFYRVAVILNWPRKISKHFIKSSNSITIGSQSWWYFKPKHEIVLIKFWKDLVI